MRLLLSGNSWDGTGGLERYFRSVARGLSERGHSVTCLVAGSAVAAPTGVDLRSLGPSTSPMPHRIWRSYVETTEVAGRCDVFNPHFAPYSLGPALAVRSAAPMVYSFHGPWAWEDWVERRGRARFWAKYLFERMLYRRAAAVVTLSLAFKALLVDRYGVAARRVHVIPAGVDLDRFSLSEGQSEARSRLDLPAGRPIVVTVRRLVRRTGVGLLLEAVRRIARQRPDVLLLIAGQGPLRGELEAQVRMFGLEANVRFVGLVPDDALPDYYRAADAVVMPSVELEGFGLVTLEALSCGAPVVGTPVGGTPEILSELEPRLVARDVGAPALAETLGEVLERPEWLPDRACCRQFVQRRYSWSHAVEALEQLFEGALAGTLGRRGGSSPIRVAYVNSDAEMSGAEINLLETVEAAAPERVEPVFVVPETGELSERVRTAGFASRNVSFGRARLGQGLLSFASGLLAIAIASWRVAWAVRRAHVDLVHANSTRAGLMASFGRVLHRRPVVWSVHDFLPGGVVGSAIRFVSRVGASVVIVNSEAVRRDVEDGHRLRPALRRIYPVLVPRTFDRRTLGSREVWKLPSSAFVVGYVGQITPWKRVHDAIAAFEILAGEVPDSRLIVAGAPKFRPENRRYLDELLASVHRRGLEQKVLFVGFQADVLSVYAALHVLVHPAAREPFGRVVAEAMAQGLPVVATAEGGVPEIVVEGVTGLLCRGGDVEAMGRALVQLARAPELRRRLGSASVERARAVFHVDRALDDLLNVYTEVMEPARKYRRVRRGE